MGFAVAGTFVSHPTIFIAGLKYVFHSGWGYPFYSVILLNGALFVSAIFYFIYKLRYYQTLTDSFFIFDALDLIKLSVCFCGEWLACAYSLFQIEMTVARYIVFGSPFEFMILGAQSSARMHRPISPAHWIGMVCCIFGYAIFDILDYKGQTEINWGVKYDAGWKGPLFCFISKACRALMTMQTKLMLMKKGYRQKYHIKREMEKRRLEINPEDLDMNGFLKERVVSYDSIIFKRSLQTKSRNEVNKGGEVQVLHEQIEAEQKVIEEEKKVLREKFRREFKENKRSKSKRKFKGDPSLGIPATSRTTRKDRNFEPDMRTELDGFTEADTNKEDFEDEDKIIEERVNRELKHKIAQNLNGVQEEKRKLQEAIEEQKRKNAELETMLVDYEELPFFLHFFTGMEEFTLTKLDDIIDNPLYDNELVGYTWETSFELYGVAGGLALFPLSCLCSFFAGETPDAYNQMFGNSSEGPWGKGYVPLVIAIFFSCLFAVRGPALWKFVFAVNRSLYYSLHVFTHFFVLFFSVIFVDKSGTLHGTFCAGVMLVIIAYIAYYFVVDFLYSYNESSSNIELVKSTLPNNADGGQYNVLEIRFMEIARILGYDTQYRIMVDMAVTRNPNALLYTASAAIPSRKLFDKDYFQR